VWDGKYDEYGNRREIDVAGCAMPLQKIETIDEPRSRAEAQGKLFGSKKSHPDDFRNMLIWGDNKLVMASLLKDFKGTIDLVYIDPPFDVGADFTMDLPMGDGKETVDKDQSTLENGGLPRHVGQRHRFLPAHDVRAACPRLFMTLARVEHVKLHGPLE
jgi:adenine-specific DNA-methyltransferase